MSRQILNRELIDHILPYVQMRNEPNFGWVNSVSALNMLPGTRASWLMSTVLNAGGIAVTVPDSSGNGRTLTLNGGVIFNALDLIPYADFNGTNGYLARADEADLDIIGNEVYIGIPGLSIGGWVWFDALGNQEGIIGKNQSGVSNRSYRLIKTSTNLIRFSISGTGSVDVSADSAAIPGAGQWMFICGVFTPSTSLRIYLNNNAVDNVTSIPATIFNSASPLELGRWAGTNYMNGRQSLMFLTASALPDSIVRSFYHQTRPLFGKG